MSRPGLSSSGLSKSGLLVIAAVAILTLLSLVYFAVTFDTPQGGTTTLAIDPPGPAPAPFETNTPATPDESRDSPLPEIRIQPPDEPPPEEVAPEEVEPPRTEEGLVDVRAEEPAVELPSLNDSDSFVLEGLRAMQNGAALVRLLADEQLVRKFVVFVENTSRGEFPQTELPYRPVGEEMPVSTVDDRLFVMDESAHARFNQVVRTFVAVDTDASIALYRMLSPLFQQAYAEIGFRNVNFDDTLRAAINNVLQASHVEGPYQLVKPSVMYLYADASIENLAEVHKQLIRLGPDNTALLKSKLREFVTRL